VTRLRKAWDEADPDASIGLTGEAADEIERLRNAQDSWRIAAERIASDLEKSDDEVARLQAELDSHDMVAYKNLRRLYDIKVQKLRFAEQQLDGIRKAVTDEGSHPEFHRKVMKKHKREWPFLWRAISFAMLQQADYIEEIEERI
jgi:hypothetical protein